MGRATTSVGFIGFGFRDIGAGITITESGSTAITHHAKFLLRFNFGPDIRGNVRPNLRCGVNFPWKARPLSGANKDSVTA